MSFGLDGGEGYAELAGLGAEERECVEADAEISYSDADSQDCNEVVE